jgi:hypothetical protein
VPSVPATLYATTSSTRVRSAERERRGSTDRRSGERERRRLSLKTPVVDERRRARDERRSGLDRRVEWADSPPVRFPIEQHLVTNVAPPRIGTLIDLHV